jgi:hypothetical protein
MDLNLAVGRQDGGHRVQVLLIDRRDQLIEIGFRHAGHAQNYRTNRLCGRQAPEARQTFALEHRLQLVRRAGQQDHHGSGFPQPLAGRGAAVVGKNIGAFDDESLPFVDLGHLAVGARETALQRLGDFGMEDQFAAQRLGYGFARDVVLGGAKAAGEDRNLRARERLAEGAGETVEVVADDALAGYFDTQVVQLAGEIERVGIDALGRQHFGTDRNDFSVHQMSGRPLIPTSTR